VKARNVDRIDPVDRRSSPYPPQCLDRMCMRIKQQASANS